MSIREIKKNMIEINDQLRSKVDADCDSIRAMLTEISENAMSINSGQGLTTFLETRDRFHNEIERQRADYRYLLCKDNQVS